ncbi:MAG: hypothetical protein IT319_11675 [Anaerolineae bacterium]|nr:hypothetical protein [Anaerolineae bacterium]
MRERAAATIFMWIAQAISVGLILNSLRYTELVQSPVNPGELVAQTMLVSGQWQLATAVLLFFLIMGAVAATIAIWQSAPRTDDAKAMRATEKAKRDNRDARIKRLLATMDDEELDALEQQRLSDSRDDEDRLSLEALLRKRN